MRELEGRLNEAGDVLDLVENLDALALVLIGRLDEPYVLLAVFLWKLLLNFSAFRYGFKLSHKLIVLGAF